MSERGAASAEKRLKELRGASEERIGEVARSASPPSAKTLSKVHLFDSAALNNQKYLTQWQDLISG